jgi:uncharacterized protein (DUF849 family)
VTGNSTTRKQHPGLPVTPGEIATAALEAHRSGAAIVHIHARDPNTQLGTTDLPVFTEIVDRIRQVSSDVIINLSTGEGGRFMPGDPDPRTAGPGTTLMRPEQRVAHVEALKPDICSLDLNTMNSNPHIVINTPASVTEMAKRIYAAGVVPELELFDSGDLVLTKALLERDVFRLPMMIQLVLGVRYSAPADTATLLYLVSQLPPGSIWGAFGIGRQEFPMLAQAYIMGGHVRVGLEDNVFISKGVLARDNAHLVEKGVNLIENLGGSVATAQEARAILGLPAVAHAPASHFI